MAHTRAAGASPQPRDGEERGPPSAPHRGAARRHALRRVRPAWVLVVALYAATAALLVAGLGQYPPTPYNWETYTARDFWLLWDGGRPWRDLFTLTEGLMTDSGRSPLVSGGIWLTFSTVGPGLASMRLPLALACAAAVPLLWLVTRRHLGAGPAALAAVLLALSPAFLLYGRTTTTVGVSILLTLVTLAVLLRVANPADARRLTGREAAWILALQLALVTGAYGYGTLRLLWPVSLAVLAMELAVARRGRTTLTAALAATVVVVPIMCTVAYREDSVAKSLRRHFSVRGEQILDLRAQDYPTFLRGAAGGEDVAGPRFAPLRLVAQNGGDYVNLLLDRGTERTVTDYWNHRGRFHSRLFAPFLLVGIALAVRHVRRPEARIALVSLAGLTVPVLLSSRVDVGRLAATLPLAAVFTAVGLVAVARWLAHRFGAAVRADGGAKGRAAARVAAALAVLAVVAAAGQAGWRNYAVGLPPSRAEATQELLLGARGEAATEGAVIVEIDPVREALEVAGHRIVLSDAYEFVDVRGPEAARATLGPLPPLVHGDVLTAFDRVAGRAGACRYHYFVDSRALARFRAAVGPLERSCRHPVAYTPLPD